MSWSNVRLILAREIRDQLRDRRTMFMIVVLPILLYPLLGMSFLQISQFVRKVPTRVLVVGVKNLPEAPPLVVDGHFAPSLFSEPEGAKFLELRLGDEIPSGESRDAANIRQRVRAGIDKGEWEAALVIPDDFGSRLAALRRGVQAGTTGNLPAQSRGRVADKPPVPPGAGSEKPAELPKPDIIFSSAKEKSQLTAIRLRDVLKRWSSAVSRSNLSAAGVPAWAVVDLETQDVDLAQSTAFRGAAIWSKVLPVLLMLWALTGAFYPAVDLCAGEKERGTLETLLSSPAERSEIVLGKLLTIMIFSGVTAILNLASVCGMGSMMLKQLPGFAPPPASSILWLGLALIPTSALFSALCLALAALARSTKEGQYYLMPLLFVTMPLAVLPAAAGLELNLGNSLIPVTGLILLLRSALEGDYWLALTYLVPVLAVTLTACLLAIRWAVEQFNSESVMFRESERLDVGLWLRRTFEDRGPTPSPAAAAFCGVVILFVHFFMNVTARPFDDLRSFTLMVLVTQVATILTPTLLMTLFLTTDLRRTLLLRWPRWSVLLAAALLAVTIHPAMKVLQDVVMRLYPLSDDIKVAEGSIGAILTNAPWWHIALVVAVVPAVCEELAFRGFILSGFRRLGSPWRAIILSAVFFGLSHGVLQQSLIAGLTGVLIGWLAMQTGSILPGLVFHLVHNTTALLWPRIPASVVDRPLVRTLFPASDQTGIMFAWPVVIAGSLLALLILVWIHRRTGGSAAEHHELAPTPASLSGR